MITIEELNKRIMINDTWLVDTDFQTILRMNKVTYDNLSQQTSFSTKLDKEPLDYSYAQHPVSIDEKIKDDDIIICSERKEI